MPIACTRASVCSVEVIHADVAIVGAALIAISSRLSGSDTMLLTIFPDAEFRVVE